MNVDLNKFCATSHDPRSYLQSPFDHKGYVYACNGFILVRLSKPECADVESDAAKGLIAKAETLFSEANSSLVEPLPSVPDLIACYECKGKGKILAVECVDCDGDGEFSHGGHDYDCKECDGSGYVIGTSDGKEQECVTCAGLGQMFKTATVGNGTYDARFLMRIAELPNVLFAPNGANPGYFKFSGGEGILMPCRA